MSGPPITGGHRRGAQAVGGVELLVAVLAMLAPGSAGPVLLTLTFAAFTVVHLRDMRAGRATCSCFGEATETPPARAAALTGGTAVLMVVAAFTGASSVREVLAHRPADLGFVIPLAALGALAWRLAFTATWSGPSDLVDASALALEQRLSRRNLLLRVAVVGSALTVAPLRYLLYPGTALAAVIRPGDCLDGLCTDGYTGFCCEINNGGANTCPEDTFPGGWWMCTDYSGRQLCSDEGVRYYVDCNALPGRPFPGGCRCANDDCNHRKINCNVFRYGQCNTQIAGVTAVVCRMVVCENPATIENLHCSAALAIDDAVCGHEAPCLEPPALELAGAGGA